MSNFFINQEVIHPDLMVKQKIQTINQEQNQSLRELLGRII